MLVGSVPRLTLGTAPAAPVRRPLLTTPPADAGGATPAVLGRATADDGGTTDVAYEYRASDGALLRTLRKTGSTQTITGAHGRQHLARVRHRRGPDGLDPRRTSRPRITLCRRATT